MGRDSKANGCISAFIRNPNSLLSFLRFEGFQIHIGRNLIQKFHLLRIEIKETAIVLDAVGYHQVLHPEGHIVLSRLVKSGFVYSYIRGFTFYQHRRISSRFMHQDIAPA